LILHNFVYTIAVARSILTGVLYIASGTTLRADGGQNAAGRAARRCSLRTV